MDKDFVSIFPIVKEEVTSWSSRSIILFPSFIGKQ